MKTYLIGCLIVINCSTALAQIATDFTANDCSGNSYNLFTELNSGKVVVLCWVMPCGTCTGPSLTTYNVVQSYQAANPNTVYFYLCDDYANTTCASLNSWANGIGIQQSSWSLRFSNADIDMLDYGSAGMPKIVVLGGVNHSVFYNTNNTVNATTLQNAINTAISTTGINDPEDNLSLLTASPNPAVNTTEIKFNLSNKTRVNIELFNPEGQKLIDVYSGDINSGETKIQIDISGLSSGMYLVRLTDGNKSNYLKLVISH